MNDSLSNRWNLHYAISVGTTLILALITYFLLEEINPVFSNDPYLILGTSLRVLRMILIYLGPALLFVNLYDGNWRNFGLAVPKGKFSIGIIGGIGVYFVAIVIFIPNEIFFSSFAYRPWNFAILHLMLIAIMAAITDLWARGFVLFQLYRKYNFFIATLVQNIIWFLIHIYEIIALKEYVSVYLAILLTIFLGVMGDIVAIKSRTVTGLVIGHILLNIAILMGSKGLIPF